MQRRCTPGQAIAWVRLSQSYPRPSSSWPLADCPACSTQRWLAVRKRWPDCQHRGSQRGCCCVPFVGWGQGTAGCTLGCASVELHVIFLWVAAENTFPFLVQGDVRFTDPRPWSPLSPVWALWPWNTFVIAEGSLQTSSLLNFCCAQGNTSWLTVYYCSPLKQRWVYAGYKKVKRCVSVSVRAVQDLLG